MGHGVSLVALATLVADDGVIISSEKQPVNHLSFFLTKGAEEPQTLLRTSEIRITHPSWSSYQC